MRNIVHVVLALALLLIAAPAEAHTGDKGFATVTLNGRQVDYHYWIPLASLHQELIDAMRIGRTTEEADYSFLRQAVEERITIAAQGQSCRASPARVSPPTPENTSIAVHAHFACASDVDTAILIRDDLADALGSAYVTIANIVWPRGSRAFVFQTDAREARIDLAVGTTARSVLSFFTLGIEHILLGWDHLLFLLGLLLLGGRFAALVGIITAFTVAHSLSLAAAVLDIVTVPDALVESTIALSIAYVAAENIFRGDRASSKRWLVALVFGFVHGFGFASVLKELGLPADSLALSLVTFNLGVEAGQALLIAAAMPILLYLQRVPWRMPAVHSVSMAVFAIGMGLFVQRAFF